MTQPSVTTSQQPKKKRNAIQIINPDTGKSIFDDNQDSSKKEDSKDEAVTEIKTNESATEVSYFVFVARVTLIPLYIVFSIE